MFSSAFRQGVFDRGGLSYRFQLASRSSRRILLSYVVGLLAKLFLDAFEGPHGGFRNTRTHTVQELMQNGESMATIPGAYQENVVTLFGSRHVGRLGCLEVALSIRMPPRRRRDEEEDEDAFGSAGSQLSGSEDEKPKTEAPKTDLAGEAEELSPSKAETSENAEKENQKEKDEEKEKEEKENEKQKEDEGQKGQNCEKENEEEEEKEEEMEREPENKKNSPEDVDDLEDSKEFADAESHVSEEAGARVPQNSYYFDHDDRGADDAQERRKEEEKAEEKEKERRKKGEKGDKPSPDDDGKWLHDMYYKMLEEPPKAKEPRPRPQKANNPQDDSEDWTWNDWKKESKDSWSSFGRRNGKGGKGRGKSRDSWKDDWSHSSWNQDYENDWSWEATESSGRSKSNWYPVVQDDWPKARQGRQDRDSWENWESTSKASRASRASRWNVSDGAQWDVDEVEDGEWVWKPRGGHRGHRGD
eukprot:s968_g12.t1